MILDVAVITRVFLEENGYDGLCNPDISCGCFKDELFPCGFEGVERCRPGYLGPIPEELSEYGETDGIFLEKPTKEEEPCTD